MPDTVLGTEEAKANKSLSLLSLSSQSKREADSIFQVSGVELGELGK